MLKKDFLALATGMLLSVLLMLHPKWVLYFFDIAQ